MQIIIPINMQINRQDFIEQDIRSNKVKQGFLFKKSRLVKQWKKTWIVLTRTFLYSFQYQGVYKSPSQKMALKDISTVKSFYKNQYDKGQVFRVESDDNYFYLAGNDHQQKWAWVTAIEKITQMIRNPALRDTQSLIRQSLKISTAARQSGNYRQSYKNVNSNEIDFLKKIKLKLHTHTNQINILPSKIPKTPEQKEKQITSTPTIPAFQPKERIVEKIVEVQIPVERIVERQVEKIVYVQDPIMAQHYSMLELFSALITSKLEDPKPLLDFVAFLTLSGVEKFQTAALQFCCEERVQRFFAELLLQAVNEEVAEENLNRYLGFIYVLCEREADFFYASDMKILVQIILRQLQMNRSDLNQMINLKVLKVLLSYHLNILENKLDDIHSIVEQIVSLGPTQNQQVASEVLFLIG